MKIVPAVCCYVDNRFYIHGELLIYTPTRSHSCKSSLIPALLCIVPCEESEVRQRSGLPSQARNFRRPCHSRAQVEVRRLVSRLPPFRYNSNGALVVIGSMKTCVDLSDMASDASSVPRLFRPTERLTRHYFFVFLGPDKNSMV